MGERTGRTKQHQRPAYPGIANSGRHWVKPRLHGQVYTANGAPGALNGVGSYGNENSGVRPWPGRACCWEPEAAGTCLPAFPKHMDKAGRCCTTVLTNVQICRLTP